MAMVIYGTHVFTKFEGYYGEKKQCPNCQKIYKPAFVKNSIWGHIYYIPLIPIKSYYDVICPICGVGTTMKKKEAKQLMMLPNDGIQQSIKYYAKHVLANKPEKKFQTDKSYEIWAKDEMTGEETCIAVNLVKGAIGNTKKKFGIKEIPIIDV